MKTIELIPAPTSTAAKIARQIIRQAQKDIVPADLQRAVDHAIDRFVVQLRQAATDELRFAGLNTQRNNKL